MLTEIWVRSFFVKSNVKTQKKLNANELTSEPKPAGEDIEIFHFSLFHFLFNHHFPAIDDVLNFHDELSGWFYPFRHFCL